MINILKTLQRGVLAAVVVVLSLVCTSCFTQSIVIGSGASGAQEETAQSWYLVYGLANLSQTNIPAMAKGANNYTVTFQRTFVDGLLSYILGGGLVSVESVTVRR
jgi:Bor protein